MALTFYSYLKQYARDFSSLHQKYHCLLELVKILIGNIPNCDQILEIWPTAFRTYNLFVPNFLQLPHSLFWSKSAKTALAISVYHASRAAGCSYCSAHTCAYALRRGVKEKTILFPNGLRETAILNFSRNLATVPSTLSATDYLELKKVCKNAEIEAMAMGIVMMGFLNKFMDVMGIELEQEALDDTYQLLIQDGWQAGKHVNGMVKLSQNNRIVQTDKLTTYLKVFRLAPGAIRLENKWTRGVPAKYVQAGAFLKERTGYDFPLLAQLKNKKCVRALSTILRDNLSIRETAIGLETKLLAGFVFAEMIGNTYLKKEALTLLENFTDNWNENRLIEIKEFCLSNQSRFPLETGLPDATQVALLLAKKASFSPSQVDAQTIAQLIPYLNQESIVELITWLSILQAMHRLERYLAVKADATVS